MSTNVQGYVGLEGLCIAQGPCVGLVILQNHSTGWMRNKPISVIRVLFRILLSWPTHDPKQLHVRHSGSVYRLRACLHITMAVLQVLEHGIVTAHTAPCMQCTIRFRHYFAIVAC